jgi:hypothetical protein
MIGLLRRMHMEVEERGGFLPALVQQSSTSTAATDILVEYGYGSGMHAPRDR